MAIDPNRLRRFQLAWERLTDPNEGTRQAAWNGLLKFCEHENIDIRDWRIAPKDAADLAAQNAAVIDRLMGEIKHLKAAVNRRTKNVTELEAKLKVAQAHITELEAADTQHSSQVYQARVTELEAQVSTLQARIAELETADTQYASPVYQARVTELEAQVSTLQARIAELETTNGASRIATVPRQSPHAS